MCSSKTHCESSCPAWALHKLGMSDAPLNEVHRDACIMRRYSGMVEVWRQGGGT